MQINSKIYQIIARSDKQKVKAKEHMYIHEEDLHKFEMRLVKQKKEILLIAT